MKRVAYNKKGMNPHSKKFEVVGTAKLTESEAELLNKDSKKTGIKYEKKSGRKAAAKE